MAKHIIKCAVCGKQFDTNLIQAVRFGSRRYAHATCDPDNTNFVECANKEEPELIKLKEYITKLFGTSANWARINQQIKKFKEENGYSYSGILKSLIYFYGVQNNPIEKSNGGIGIVPFIYQDAYNYYFALFQAQQKNFNKNIINLTTKVKEITIKAPERKLPKKYFFNFLEEDTDIDEE